MLYRYYYSIVQDLEYRLKEIIGIQYDYHIMVEHINYKFAHLAININDGVTGDGNYYRYTIDTYSTSRITENGSVIVLEINQYLRFPTSKKETALEIDQYEKLFKNEKEKEKFITEVNKFIAERIEKLPKIEKDNIEVSDKIFLTRALGNYAFECKTCGELVNHNNIDLDSKTLTCNIVYMGDEERSKPHIEKFNSLNDLIKYDVLLVDIIMSLKNMGYNVVYHYVGGSSQSEAYVCFDKRCIEIEHLISEDKRLILEYFDSTSTNGCTVIKYRAPKYNSVTGGRYMVSFRKSLIRLINKLNKNKNHKVN